MQSNHAWPLRIHQVLEHKTWLALSDLLNSCYDKNVLPKKKIVLPEHIPTKNIMSTSIEFENQILLSINYLKNYVIRI